MDEIVSNTKFSMQEALMSFEAGKESMKFTVGEKVVSLRKQNTIVDGEEVLIVIVKDCTDSANLEKS
jgi:hypothetical protein